MICKIVKGRLGNQMFQYAAMRSIQLNKFPNEELKFYFKYVKKKGKSSDGFKNSLSDFNIVENIEIDKLKISFIQRVKILLLLTLLAIIKIFIKNEVEFDDKRTVLEKKMQTFLNKSGIFWITNGYCSFNYSYAKQKNKIFYGYFESKKFMESFDNISDVLRNDFSPKYNEMDKNKKLYEEIRNNNSVCISIRRGDFITNLIYKKKHYICDENYFYQAINLMNKLIAKPKYIIFSDDVEWVKNNMKFPNDTLFEDGNDPVWEKLRLMYSCKHFIISNSSFSWWAQYLSNNKEKRVIAPKKWINGRDNPDIYDEKWILL